MENTVRNAPKTRLARSVPVLLLLLPAMVLMSVFVFVPAAMAIVGSLFRIDISFSNWEFVGMANYARAAGDPVVWTALRNNLIIVVGSIIFQVGMGTILAAILDRGVKRFSVVFRTIIFAPMIVSALAVALIWVMLLDPNFGIVKSFFDSVGLPSPRLGWLGDGKIAIWTLLLIACWQYTGFMMVIILAGLQSVPKEIYEAANLDGARGLRAFWYITLPSIRNVLILAVLLTTIGGIKVFDLVFVTTQGGPANATQVLGTYIYLHAFNLGNMGYANAISVILLILAVVFGALQLRMSRRA